MIPGITASERRHHSGGPVYTASAVTFGGSTTLVNSSLTSADNNFVSFAGWFKPTPGDFGSSVPFVVDPSGNYDTWFEFQSGSIQLFFRPSGSGTHAELDYDTFGALNPHLNAGRWIHVIGSFNGTGTNPWEAQLYVNDIQVNLEVLGTGGAVTPIANGLEFWVGDDGQGDPYSGSMADLSFWPGVSFLEIGGDIPLAVRRLFIDASGAPVNPATAIAMLGTPAVMLSGGASTFPLNALGGSGALTVTTGSLTNDLSSVHL